MMSVARWVLTSFIFYSVLSCANNSGSIPESWSTKPLPLNTTSSGEPKLFCDAQNQIYLSWIEYLDDSTDALQYAQLNKGGWSSPIEISRGNNWFVNWADFPSVVKSSGHNSFFAGHFLEMSGLGTYDYDVKISLSKNGEDWSAPFTLHQDGISAEHGFVSLLPLPNNRLLATWLDGRNTKSEMADTSGDDHPHGHRGAMTLRVAEIASDGNVTNQYELDDRVCDCCQTDAALTSSGPVIVYRDRSEEEVRDIFLARKEDNLWLSPRRVFADEWVIGGCPVNGPAVAADKQQVVVAWYTESDQVPKVQFAWSNDGGASFGPAMRSDDGDPLGRIDLVIHHGATYQTWLEKTKDGDAEIRIRLLHKDGLRSSQTIEKIAGSRSSGFPTLASNGDNLVLAYTDVSDDTQRVNTVMIDENP